MGVYHTLLKNQSKDLQYTLLIVAFVVTLCSVMAYKKPLITGEMMLIVIFTCIGVCVALLLFLPKYLLWMRRKKIVKELKKHNQNSLESVTRLEYLAES